MVHDKDLDYTDAHITGEAGEPDPDEPVDEDRDEQHTLTVFVGATRDRVHEHTIDVDKIWSAIDLITRQCLERMEDAPPFDGEGIMEDLQAAAAVARLLAIVQNPTIQYSL